MADVVSASSPADKPGDGKQNVGGRDNVTLGDAAAALMAFVQKDKAETDAQRQATPSIAAENAVQAEAQAEPTTQEAPAAEAQSAPTEVATEAEQTAETTPTASEPEETTDVLSQTHSLTTEQREQVHKILGKRIGKEVAKTKAAQEIAAEKVRVAEAKVAELEARINTVAPQTQSQAPIASSGPDPLGHVQDLAALAKERDNALQTITTAEEWLETPKMWKTHTDDAGVETKYVQLENNQVLTEDAVRGARRQARTTVDRLIPQKAAFLQQRDAARQSAVKQFSFLTDKTAPEYNQVQEAFRMYPVLNTFPNSEELAAYLVEGRKAVAARQAAEAEKAKPAVAAKPKVVTAKPPNDQAAVSANGAPTSRVVGQQVNSRLAQLQAKVAAKGNASADDARALMLESAKSTPRR